MGLMISLPGWRPDPGSLPDRGKKSRDHARHERVACL